MADPTNLTPLEQQVINDYGKYMYKAVDVPTNYKLTGALPTGVSLVGNQLRVDPSSSLYGTTGDMFAAIQGANQPKSTGLSGIGGLSIFGRKPSVPTPFTFNNPRRGFGGIGGIGGFGGIGSVGYNGMGGYNVANGFGRMASFGGFGRRSAPVQNVATEVQATRTLDEALQEYLRKSGESGHNMSYDDLKKQIEAKRANMAQVDVTAPQAVGKPLSIDELNAKYMATPGYAEGGYVRGYAEGDLVEDPNKPAADVQTMPYIPEAAPSFIPVTQGQTEPAGGGYVPAPATAAQANPQLAGINPELYALMQQYTTGPDYTQELKRVGQERATAEAGFNKALEGAMAGADQGPSKAELYFRLAAAFGTPTKTGAFGEGLAQAAGAAAEHKKEERVASTAKRKLATDILLKKQELALEGVKDREKTLLALQSENSKDRREAIKGIIKDYIDSGKPQSEAGKIAKDKGFKVGTPEYQGEVDKQAKILLENKLAQINATLAGIQIQSGRLALETKKEERTASELDASELKLLTENKQAIKSSQSALELMDEAATLADKAFTKSTADQAEYKRLKTTNPSDPRVVATEQLEQILTTSGLAGLRSSFGGNPTEGERNVQLLTQGLGATSSASRKQIINRVKNGLVKNKAFYDESNADLLSGAYKKKPAAKE